MSPSIGNSAFIVSSSFSILPLRNPCGCMQCEYGWGLCIYALYVGPRMAARLCTWLCLHTQMSSHLIICSTSYFSSLRELLSEQYCCTCSPRPVSWEWGWVHECVSWEQDTLVATQPVSPLALTLTYFSTNVMFRTLHSSSMIYLSTRLPSGDVKFQVVLPKLRMMGVGRLPNE